MKKRLEALQKPFSIEKMEKISKSKNQNVLKAAEIFGEDGIEELEKLIEELDAGRLNSGKEGDQLVRQTHRPYQEYESVYDTKAEIENRQKLDQSKPGGSKDKL